MAQTFAPSFLIRVPVHTYVGLKPDKKEIAHTGGGEAQWISGIGLSRCQDKFAELTGPSPPGSSATRPQLVCLLLPGSLHTLWDQDL